MPVIFLDFYDNKIAKDSVIADNFYGMYQMTELLFERGLERIGFMDPSMLPAALWTATADL